MKSLKMKKNYLNKYILVFICILFFLFIFYFFINEYLKNRNEYFENMTSPTYIFFYGNLDGKDQDKLRKLFKDEYKESTMTIKVMEKDLKNMKDMNEYKKYDLSPKFEYEVRYYPKGLNEEKNYEKYYGKIDDLKDIILEKENSFNDLLSEEDNKDADKEFKSLNDSQK